MCLLFEIWAGKKCWRLRGVMFCLPMSIFAITDNLLEKQIEWQENSIFIGAVLLFMSRSKYDILSYFIDRHFVLMDINCLALFRVHGHFFHLFFAYFFA